MSHLLPCLCVMDKLNFYPYFTIKNLVGLVDFAIFFYFFHMLSWQKILFLLFHRVEFSFYHSAPS